MPILVSDFPLLEGVLLPCLKTLELGFRIDMKPEFYDHGAVVTQMGLHLVDFTIGSLPFFVGTEFFDPLDQNPAVPGTIEYFQATSTRQTFTESPKVISYRKIVFAFVLAVSPAWEKLRAVP